MKISSSFIWATVIGSVTLFWMFSDDISNIFVNDQKLTNEQTDENKAHIIDDNQNLIISAIEVENEFVPVYYRSTGVTKSIFDIEIITRREGLVEGIQVKDGSFINKGDVILKLEKGTLQKELDATNALLLAEKNELNSIKKKFGEGGSHEKHLESAKASLLRAKRNFESSKKLQLKGIKTELEVSKKYEEYKVAEATLSDLLDISEELLVTKSLAKLKKINFDIEKIREQLAFTKVISPRSGWIENIKVDVGEYVNYNMSVARLIGLSDLLLEMQIPQSNIDNVKLGDSVEITFDNKKYYYGEVVKIGAVANDSTRTFEIEVYIKNRDMDLRAGMSGEARIMIDKVNAFKISPAHLTADNVGNLYVKIIGPSKTVENRVTKIVKTENNFVYISGLNDKSIILTTGQAFLKEGDKPKFKISKDEL